MDRAGAAPGRAPVAPWTPFSFLVTWNAANDLTIGAGIEKGAPGMWSRLLRGKKRCDAPSRLSKQEVRTLVTALYRGFLGREPEPNGLQSWMQQIERGTFDTSLLERFLRSPEHVAKAVAETDTDGLCHGLASFLTSHGFRGPLTIVEVGAQMHKTKDHAYARLLDLVPCRIVGFEPLDERRREREEAEGGGSLSMRPDFIGDVRTHVFHINEPDVTSSLLPLNDAVTGHLMQWNRVKTVRQVSADTVTLNSAIDQGERVDLLQLDIQGFDTPALAGAPSVLARTLAVHCEVEFLELYPGPTAVPRRSTSCCERPDSGFWISAVRPGTRSTPTPAGRAPTNWAGPTPSTSRIETWFPIQPTSWSRP